MIASYRQKTIEALTVASVQCVRSSKYTKRREVAIVS